MEKPSISILAVDDEETILQPLKKVLEIEGYYVNTAADGRIAITMLQTLPFDLVLLDVMMPNLGGVEVLKFIKDQHLDTEVIMLTAVHEVKTAVECMKLGAYYYITKPYNTDDLLALIERAIERKRLVIQNKGLKRQIALSVLPTSMVGQNKSFLKMMHLASRVASTDSTVLIQGASGTGKELVAEFIHVNSPRKDQAFLAVNCSSIPESLLESELFGHEKGSFTDASNKKQGLVEIADGGTLFLDEVAEMPLSIQPKLLRFLQTGEFRRVGGNVNLKSDVRLVSATNRDLRQEATERRFREDLLFRLNVITLQVPSLCERKDDIPALVDHFLGFHAGARQPKRVEERALEILMKYDWPGNVRELGNVIERAVILSQDDVICFDDLAMPLRSASAGEPVPSLSSTGPRAGSAISLLDIQKVHVEAVLVSVNWDKELAAKILGIRINTLYGKIRSYRLKKPK
ncbi:MAG: sigma-54 dependent transcriptional regulator [Ignavibacteriales bacterium]|nr:sigma-54 dependent transcriptional regulator [Ignavibacteriales bacterium]